MAQPPAFPVGGFVGVEDGVTVTVGVVVRVDVALGVTVGVKVGVGLAVGVVLAVEDGVPVGVALGNMVAVGVSVGGTVGVAVAVGIGGATQPYGTVPIAMSWPCPVMGSVFTTVFVATSTIETPSPTRTYRAAASGVNASAIAAPVKLTEAVTWLVAVSMTARTVLVLKEFGAISLVSTCPTYTTPPSGRTATGPASTKVALVPSAMVVVTVLLAVSMTATDVVKGPFV